MPRGDRTGPRGFGPMTGRVAGYCAGYPIPGFMNPIPGWGRGRGFGRGFGRGWGRGRLWYPPPQYQPPYPSMSPFDYRPAHPLRARPQTPEQEVAALEDYQKELEAEKADLEEEMGAMVSRLEELKAAGEGKKQQ